MDYREAGVDIDGGDSWVRTIGRLISRREGLPKSGIGGFNGSVSIGGGRSIVACCDGVGTKIELARETGIYRGLGQDLVAMSVNDLITCGAAPLFFMDYIACGALDETKMKLVMEGILDGCEMSGCALLGGETAEMPGVYAPDGFDLAGFAAGVADDEKMTDGSRIAAGDVITGLPSSGVHSNGYSLIRRILRDTARKRETALDGEPEWGDGGTLGEILMRPTVIYVKPALEAVKTGIVQGMAHIPGGGLESNIGRVVPDGLKCEIDYGSWLRPAVFDFISGEGVEESEMRRVFNLGVGYVFITGERDSDEIARALKREGAEPRAIGRITEAS
ncbi:MAG: phosphoribosylformylglycinamidine cyclo-ligase [Synergistaceae bacterium]|jgi:phosphoribosylformylglycinamidine cyclo-ligase|nr:phosphoribosylformylglycinamidine cyclo-ligase [Synergistaceae bacterium]